jgi:hypothetical protein
MCVMLHQFICVSVTFGLLLAGCQTPTHERALVRYEPSGRAEVRKAPYHGQYRLYAARTKHPTTASATPVVEARLAKGELVGFARDGVGGLFAVVRGERQPLPAPVAGAASERAYVWTMQPDPEQIDWTRTALLVGTIVVVGVAIGVAVAAASSASSSTTAIAWPL